MLTKAWPAFTVSPSWACSLVTRPKIGELTRLVKFSSKLIFPLNGSAVGATISVTISILRLASCGESSGRITSSKFLCTTLGPALTFRLEKHNRLAISVAMNGWICCFISFLFIALMYLGCLLMSSQLSKQRVILQSLRALSRRLTVMREVRDESLINL